MARRARYANEEIEVARRMASEARTTQQLRQSQVILLPALTGATLETTAEVLGLSRGRVCVRRRQFRSAGAGVEPAIERRGGRRRELMTLDEEKAFLSPWIDKAASGGVLVVPPIHGALEKRVGHKVPRSTVYRLLARHGWRKIAPDTRHPKADTAVQEAFKKTLRKSSRSG